MVQGDTRLVLTLTLPKARPAHTFAVFQDEHRIKTVTLVETFQEHITQEKYPQVHPHTFDTTRQLRRQHTHHKCIAQPPVGTFPLPCPA